MSELSDYGVAVQDDGFRRALLDPSSLLDVPHHDVPERHEIGKALITPGAPKTIGPNTPASSGTSPAPARADHTHGFDPLATTPVAWNPTISQGAAGNITKTIFGSDYIKQGRLVTAIGFYSVTGNGAAGSQLRVTLPIPMGSQYWIGGSGMIYKAAVVYVCYVTMGSDGTNIGFHCVPNDNGNSWGATPNLAIGPGDQIRFVAQYWSAP